MFSIDLKKIHDRYSWINRSFRRRPYVIRSGTREVHNKLEKNRRAHLKECFEMLKKQLPAQDEKKSSNLSILHAAIRHIQVRQTVNLLPYVLRSLCVRRREEDARSYSLDCSFFFFYEYTFNVRTVDGSRNAWDGAGYIKIVLNVANGMILWDSLHVVIFFMRQRLKNFDDFWTNNRILNVKKNLTVLYPNEQLCIIRTDILFMVLRFISGRRVVHYLSWYFNGVIYSSD